MAPPDAPDLPLDPRDVPSAPRRPSARARKLLLRYEGSQGARMIIGLVFLGLGMIAVLAFLYALPGDLALEVAASHATGRLQACAPLEHFTVNEAHPTAVRFEFPADGRLVQGESYTLEPCECEIDGEVEVEYLSALPSVARVTDTTLSPAGWTPVFVLIFPLVGLGLAGSAFYENQRDKAVYRDGRPRLAQVTFRGMDMNTTINRRHPHLIRWRYMIDGREHEGRYGIMDPIPEMLGSGEQVLVLVHPRNPGWSCLWIADEAPTPEAGA
jgi:hypothetical protein